MIVTARGMQGLAAIERSTGAKAGISRTSMVRARVQAKPAAKKCPCLLPASVNRDKGSWISSLFNKATGTKLSDAIGPIATIVGGAVGGPAGAAIGSVVGSIAGNTGSSGTPTTSGQVAPPAPGQTVPQDGAYDGIAKVITAMNIRALTDTPAPQQPAPKAESQIDQKTLLIGGGIFAGLVLLVIATK